MSSANLTHLKEKVSHSDAVLKWGNAHGLTNDDTIQMTQDYMQHSGASSAMAMTRSPGITISLPWKLSILPKHIQTETGFGNALGVEKAFRSAKENGFNGTMADYQSMREDIDSRKGFLNAQTVKQMADTYFNGDTNQLLRHEALYSQAQTASMLRNFAHQNVNPEEVGDALGRAKSLDALAKQDYLFAAGDSNYFKTQSAQLYDAAAKHVKRTAMDEIATHGRMTHQTRSNIRSLLSSQMGSAQLRAHGGMETTIRGEREANNFGIFKKSGSGCTIRRSGWVPKYGCTWLRVMMGILKPDLWPSIKERSLQVRILGNTKERLLRKKPVNLGFPEMVFIPSELRPMGRPPCLSTGIRSDLYKVQYACGERFFRWVPGCL